MGTIAQDLRHSIRALIKSPFYTSAVLLVLALAIGANTAVFSVINTVLIEPLPYTDSDRLVMVWGTNKQQGSEQWQVSPADFFDWKAQNHVFENVALFRGRSRNLTGGDEPERVIAAIVTFDLFPLLGAKPFLGRDFLPEEDQPGASKVVILSHSLWQRRFGGDPDLIGKPIKLDSESYTVVGIMPADFWFFWLGDAELWVTLGLGPNRERGNHFLQAVARLKPGVTLQQAQAEMDIISGRLEQEYPDSNAGIGIRLAPLQKSLVKDIQTALLIFWGAVSFVLLIACANIANLLVARATSRRKEIAIRLALGATRARIIRQLLTENLFLSLVGGSLGLMMAFGGIKILIRLIPGDIPRLDAASLDARVAAFTLLISILTGILFGLLPALHSSKSNLHDSLKEGGRGTGAGASQKLVLRLLMISEVALAFVLLIGAGLLIESFQRLSRVDPGFQTENLLTMQMIPRANYPETRQQAAFIKEVLERVRTLPEVESAAEINFLPFSGNDSTFGFAIEGRPASASGKQPSGHFRAISPGYFHIMRIPILEGRDFTEDDVEKPGSVIINQAMANRFWPAENPLNRRINYQGKELSIVGVVGDVKHTALNAEPMADMYFPYSLDTFSIRTIILRMASDPASLAAAARREVWAVNRNQSVFNLKTMDQVVAESVAQPRFNAALLSIFAIVALALAAVGIYSVIAYWVSQRTNEIGIRMALGARPSDVLRLVLRQGMSLTLTGFAIGLAASLVLTRLLSRLLFQVSATDPATFVITSALLMAAAMLACYLPARRAMKVDPMIALRCE